MATSDSETENVIRPAERRTRPAGPRDAREEESSLKKRALPREIPEEVRRRFVQVGHRYHFQDGARAFTDRGTRLTTPSENTEVIKSLIVIAEARGWESISVKGTERFRKEAWFQAKLAGLQVRGYVPSEVEQARLVRALARQEPVEASASDRKTSGRAGPESRAADRMPDEPRRPDRLIKGRLLEHGAAPYRHERGQPKSYFVKVETARGERTVWGTDLERAIKESLSRPAVGEEVGLRVVGQDDVTVKGRRADTGAPTGPDLATQRNRWVVESRAFFEARATAAEIVRNPKIEARDAVKRHPELASTYLHLKGAEEVAAQRIRDPQDQRRFVSMVRSALADSVERGEPLQPVRLRQPAEKAKPDPERSDRQPTRTR
jgi:putative DNA primase/helicase